MTLSLSDYEDLPTGMAETQSFSIYGRISQTGRK